MPVHFRSRNSHTRFVDMSLHRRRDAVVQLRWRIARSDEEHAQHGFWTDHLLIDPVDPQRIHDWIDLTFIGADRCTLWNAEFLTTRMVAQDKAREWAFEHAHAQLSPQESQREFSMQWKAVPRARPSAPRLMELLPQPKIHYAKFEGRTFREECDRLETLYAASNANPVGESFTTHRNYAYGIGLTAVVDEENLDCAAIVRTIQRFRDIGESNWQSV
ncbi:MAG: hypothetical protein CFE43_03180 [Burkholderiales bacterium PBB3]|nr:MAG: hypothetical protein CFE43_03180 [Burkholderiales bacterium PBB3]